MANDYPKAVAKALIDDGGASSDDLVKLTLAPLLHVLSPELSHGQPPLV